MRQDMRSRRHNPHLKLPPRAHGLSPARVSRVPGFVVVVLSGTEEQDDDDDDGGGGLSPAWLQPFPPVRLSWDWRSLNY
jgi:hypothetical protein